MKEYLSQGHAAYMAMLHFAMGPRMMKVHPATFVLAMIVFILAGYLILVMVDRYCYSTIYDEFLSEAKTEENKRDNELMGDFKS